jgi:hypothetical protein
MRKIVFSGLACIGLACRGGSGSAADTTGRDTAVVRPPVLSTVPDTPATVAPPPTGVASRSSATGTARRVPPASSVAAPNPGVQASDAQHSDTVRGIVSVNGTDRNKRTMIAPAGGGRHVEITGPLATIVARAAGTDVWVTGTSSGTSLAATRFLVRTADGAPAIDGRLRIEGGVTYIVPDDGTRIRIVNPPPSFQGRDGGRVWITGDPARGVAAFGFIDPPR